MDKRIEGNGKTDGVSNSPPRRGGVDARLIRRREATLFRADGVVSSAQSVLREGMGERRRSALFNARKKKLDRGNLRKSSTPAEAVLWTYLQNRKLLGKKFRRQSSVGPYIVDFYCPECRLVIELDGAPHFGPNTGEYDQQRTEYLEQAGLKVIRFENKAVRENIEFVLKTIEQSLQPN